MNSIVKNLNLKFKVKPSVNLLILFNLTLFISLLIMAYLVFSSNGANNSPQKWFSPKPTLKQIQASAKSIFDNCTKFTGRSREDCYKQNFDALVNTHDFRYGQDAVYAIQDFDPNLRHCHVLSHHVANSALRKSPKDWKKLLSEADVNTCGAGFFHGVIEARVQDNPDFEINPSSIGKICDDDKLVYKERTCYHIMGHLVLFSNQGDVEKSLPICAQITETDRSRQCYTGLFMEDSFKTILSLHGLGEVGARDKSRMERQTLRCLKSRGVPAEGCWMDLAEIFQEYYKNEAKYVYKSCNTALEQEARRQCYLKAVILMVISPYFDSKERLTSVCQPYENNPADYKHCTYQIINSLTIYSPKFTTRAITLCSNLNLNYQSDCFGYLGSKLKTMVPSKDERLTYCKGTPIRYQNLCVEN